MIDDYAEFKNNFKPSEMKYHGIDVKIDKGVSL
jgi:hypothetical protein